MGARYLSVTLFLALLAVPAAADQAQGSGSDDARRVGARHHSPRPSRSTPTAVPRNPGASHSSFSDAVNRHPRAGTGHGSRGRFFFRPSRHYYYSPYRTYYGYGGFPYFDFYYGYGYGNGYGYGHYPYYGGYYPGRYDYRGDRGSVRVLVDPPQTRVYVDGYYAGVADDFDGFFQRLHVAPGRHEIGLRLEGFQPHRLRVYVPYDGTLKIHHDMVEGDGDGGFENLAGDADEPRAAAPWRDEPREPRDERRRESRYGARSAEVTGNASVRFDVRPEGASIYVDGEFQGTGGSLHSLELPGGTHRVEILHPGLRTFERDLTLRPGDSFDLEVELTK